MITYKTEKEIEILAKGGKILSRILRQVIKKVKPGITTFELDFLAESLILKAGGRPSFKGYQRDKKDMPFPSCLCISINNEVVHAPAVPPRTLYSGDIVSFDLGMEFEGFYTDMAATVGVDKISKQAKKLTKVTRQSLICGIKQIRPGASLYEIGKAIENCVKKEGFSVVRDLVGHGVGYAVHEDPQIPNYFSSFWPEVKLKTGMVLALEPMVVAGGPEVRTLSDGWTVVTADGNLACHFEATVAVMKKGFRILTPLL